MLDGTDGNPIRIDGLWVLVFGNDASAGGPRRRSASARVLTTEPNGLFGSITHVENTLGGNQ